MTTTYWANSIKKLTQRESARQKFGMYIGDNGNRWFHHLLYEILSNSIDEMMNGYGDKIIVRLLDKNTIEVEDFGRWIPFWKNKDWEEVLQMIFSTLHAGWKMDNTNTGSGYKISWGTNGVGTSIVNFLSTDLYIRVKKEGQVAELKFHNSETDWLKIVGKCNKWESGTLVRFSPDLSIFPSMKWFDEEYIKKLLHDQAILQKSHFIFENTMTNEVFEFSNAHWIKQYIIEKNNEKDENEENERATKLITPISSIVDAENISLIGPKGQYVSIDFALELIQETKSILRGYSNSIYNPDGGVHILGLRNWVYQWIKNVLELSPYKNLSKDLERDDILSSLVAIINVKLSDPMFEGQTKGKLTNDYIQKLVSTAISQEIERKLTDKDIKEIARIIELRIEHRKNIKALELKSLEKLKNDSAVQKKLWTKLLDANTKDRRKADLYIIEGDSAAGSLKAERDQEYHAIMPLKWKAINIENASKNKILENKELNNIIYAISSGYIGKEFDINKHMRYGKIILLSDADVDGMHINLLVLTILINFYPSIIEAWMVYMGMTPLFVCKYKDDYHYFYTEQEKNKFLAQKGNEKYSTSRFKGLWEMNPKELYKVALWKDRTLVQVSMSDFDSAKEMISLLMWGEPRKKLEFVQSYISEFLEKLEANKVFDVRKNKDIEEVAKDNLTMYQKEVNEERGIHSVEDGCKNVHRRIIYTLHKRLNSTSTWNYIKSARVVWEVMWVYHPHGDSSIFDAMVGITQEFANNFPMVQWMGAFGSIYSKWWVAAMRYNEVRMWKISEDILLENIHKNSVTFIPNYDSTTEEPIVLPAKLPFSLIKDNKWVGAAWVSTDMPSHNIREVIQAVLEYIKSNGKDYNASDYIKWPDLPMWGILMNTTQEIKEMYKNPNGWSYTIRLPIYIEKKGRSNVLIVKDVQYQMYSAEDFMVQVNDLIDKKNLLWVKSIKDASIKKWRWKDEKELIIEIEYNNAVDFNLIIEDLYKKTQLEKKFRYYPMMVNRYRQLRQYSLNEIISYFVEFRKETLLNIFNYELSRRLRDIEIQEAKKIFSNNIEVIVKIIKEGKTRESIKKTLQSTFKITEDQSEIIITTQLINIKDIKVIEDKLKTLNKEKASFEKLINNPKTLKKYMVDEYEKMLETYKNVRRKTKIITNKEIEEAYSKRESLEKVIKAEKNKIEDKIIGIAIGNNDFIYKLTGKEDAITNKITEMFDKEQIKSAHIGNNKDTLYLLSDKQKWYFLHCHKLKDKESTAITRLIKNFEGNIKGTFIFWEWVEDSPVMIIYEDNNGSLWAYKIMKSDLAKNKNGYALWKVTILYATELEELKLSSIVPLTKYNIKKDVIIKMKDLPLKKSPSSWKKI